MHTDLKSKKAHKRNASNQCLSRQQQYTPGGMLYWEIFPLAFTLCTSTLTRTKMHRNTQYTLAHTLMQRKGSCSQPALSLCPQAQSQLFYPHCRREQPCIFFCHTDTTREMQQRNTKPERSREKGRSTETERGIKQEKKRDRRTERSKEL